MWPRAYRSGGYSRLKGTLSTGNYVDYGPQCDIYPCHADMRIVASTARMLEEPYWRIEEPNPLMDEPSETRKWWK